MKITFDIDRYNELLEKEKVLRRDFYEIQLIWPELQELRH